MKQDKNKINILEKKILRHTDMGLLEWKQFKHGIATVFRNILIRYVHDGTNKNWTLCISDPVSHSMEYYKSSFGEQIANRVYDRRTTKNKPLCDRLLRMVTDDSARKTICIDLDGVIHKYSDGWKGAANIYDEPMPGIANSIREMHKEYKIIIYTTRAIHKSGEKATAKWLEKHNIPYDYITYIKIPAKVYIDDRAMRFTPDMAYTLKEQVDSIIHRTK